MIHLYINNACKTKWSIMKDLKLLKWRTYVSLLLYLLKIIQKANGITDCNNEAAKDESIPCGGPGSFINLCGFCVGGQTLRPDTEGIDRCKVCNGDDSCIGCDGMEGSNKMLDACGECLASDDELRDNCTKITSVFPVMLDRAVDKVMTVILRGAGINPTNLNDVNCSLQPTLPQQQEAQVEKLSVEDGLIQLEVILTDKLGVYAVQCTSSSSGSLTSDNQVTLSIVDSKQLCVTEFKPSKVAVGSEFQMEMTIPALLSNRSVFCYVRRKEQESTEVLKATEVMTGRIKCAPYSVERACRMEWGAGYTWDAAVDRESCPSSAELTVTAPPPVMKEAEFFDGLRQIRIVFDHNVDGTENCSDIFAPETLEIVGNGANCSYVANNLIVTLGSDSKLQGNSEIQLSDNSKVFREQSDSSLTAPASGKVSLIAPDLKTSTPQYEVIAPKFICPDPQVGMALYRTGSYAAVMNTNNSNATSSQIIRIAPSGGGQTLSYNWKVNFTATPGTQQHNLKVWKSVRMLEMYLRKTSKSLQGTQIAINLAMLMPGIEYKLSVIGTNILGIPGKEQQISFQVMPYNTSDASLSNLILKGPSTTWSNADYYIEATFESCEPQIMRPKLSYEWKIDGELSRKIELPKGRILHLRRGTLQGGQEYNISCNCISDAKESAIIINKQTWKAVTVLQQGIKAQITKQEIILGTGQTLQLDASQSEDLDEKLGKLQFSWCCRLKIGGRCLLPRAGEPVTVESAFKDAFQQPMLTIPPGSLPVGSYIFTVEVSKPGATPAKAQTDVQVVAGKPAIVNIPHGSQLGLVNPKEGVTIPAVVMNTREGCRMWWSVQQEPGHEYFNLAEAVGLGDTVLVKLEEAKDVMGREFPLVIPGPTDTWPGLKDNAVYRLRLSVFCPQQGKLKSVKSHADFLITTNSPPVVKHLKVSPAKGEALRTKFVFTTDLADDSSSDHPLLYKYGYRVSDQEQIRLFSTSNVELQATTTLPAITGNENVIIPVLIVCDIHQLCSTLLGEQVTTMLPKNFTLVEVQKIGEQFADYVAAQQYSEALSVAQMSLQTLKQLPNQSLYTAGVEIVETEIQKELKRKQDGLNANSESLQSSLDFLDMAINVLIELPMSGSTLQDLGSFRDKILSLTKHSSDLKVKPNSFQERHSTSPKKPSRQRRSSGDSKENAILSIDTVQNYLRLSEKIINNGNKIDVLKEKKKLLQVIPNYIYHLCLKKDQKLAMGNSIVHFSVQKLSSKEYVLQVQEFSIPDGTKQPPNEIGLINLGKSVAEKVGSTGSACLGGSMFPDDYLTDVAVWEDPALQPQSRGSAVFGVMLVNVKNNNSKLDQPVNFRIPATITQLGNGKMLQCAMWQNNSWSNENCETEQSITLQSQIYAVCKCKMLGYYTVLIADIPTTTTTTVEPTTTAATTTTTMPTTTTFPTTTDTTIITDTTSTIATTLDITTNTEEQTLQPTAMISSTSTTEIISRSTVTSSSDAEQFIPCENLPPSVIKEGIPVSSSSYNISFRIDEDFNTTIGGKRKEFVQKLYCEILAQIKMPVKMIQYIEITPGSIVVTVRLVDTDVKTVKEVIPAIAQALQNGELNVHGFDNQKLNVPIQHITIMEPYRSDKSNVVVYAVVGSVVASTFAIVLLIAGAVIIKKRKDAEKFRKQQIPTVTLGVPTYRKFQFEHSIEGTEASLARYRSTYPTMGTAGTLVMGTVTGTGSQVVMTLGMRPGGRNETQFNDNQYLHPDISCNASQSSRKKKKKKKHQQGIQQAGSRVALLNSEETPFGDQDSGIVDGCINASDDRNVRQRTRDKKNSSGSAVEFDVLPGTPTEDT